MRFPCVYSISRMPASRSQTQVRTSCSCVSLFHGERDGSHPFRLMSLNLLQRRVAWAIVVIPAAVLCSLSARLQCGALLRLYRRRCQILASNEVIDGRPRRGASHVGRSEEHTSELQSLMRTSYA